MKKRDLLAHIEALAARVAVLEAARALPPPRRIGDYPPSTPWNPSPTPTYTVRYGTGTCPPPANGTYTYTPANQMLGNC